MTLMRNSVHSLSNLCASRSGLTSDVTEMPHFLYNGRSRYKHVPTQFYHWDCLFAFWCDQKCTFTFSFSAHAQEKLWKMGLNVSLCVYDGMSLRLSARNSSIMPKKIFRVNVTMLERFSKFVDKFQIWLKSGKKRPLNITTHTHF